MTKTILNTPLGSLNNHHALKLELIINWSIVITKLVTCLARMLHEERLEKLSFLLGMQRNDKFYMDLKRYKRGHSLKLYHKINCFSAIGLWITGTDLHRK